MSGPKLRPAVPEDADAIARVWHGEWSDGHLGHVPESLALEEVPRWPYCHQSLTAPASPGGANSAGIGDPPWTRTMNPEIKSLLLYQLS